MFICFMIFSGIVEVQLRFVQTETRLIVGTEPRQVLIDAGEDRLPIAGPDTERRQAAAGIPAGAVGPDAVWSLRREIGVEALARSNLRDRHDVADLGEEFVPALVREHLAGRTAFDRSHAGEPVAEGR